MATLYTQQSKNIEKTWLLMAVFLAVVIGVGYFLSYYYQNSVILYFAIIFAVVMNFVSYLFSDKIVTKLAGAKEVKREEYFDLYNIVENLAITAGLPKPKIYIITDPAPNAFATGRNPAHAVVCVTTGLLSILDKAELEGVISHEISHIGNNDILLSTVAAVLVGFISILANMFTHSLFFGGRRSNDREGNGNGIIMAIGIILMILSPIIATLIQLAISRKREYLADASGALLTRYPEGLASALQKIGNYAQPLAHQSEAIAHLYIADPKGKTSRIKNLFMTHPPITDRIKALLNK
ncbi:MAG: M48 family metalloprotease [Candidatus Nomurabacteria bacterium]|nr:M48 family metalloprotease [Candidatus Nomurabacteria bacterium]